MVRQVLPPFICGTIPVFATKITKKKEIEDRLQRFLGSLESYRERVMVIREEIRAMYMLGNRSAPPI